MRAADIAIGDRLQLKRDNAYGFGPEIVTVLSIDRRDGYKTPWIHGEFNWVNPYNDLQTYDRGSFKPSDFARAIR